MYILIILIFSILDICFIKEKYFDLNNARAFKLTHVPLNNAHAFKLMN